ncbi:hypothetical protein OsI_11396 [Oryza sativa Indica Group]|uniref:Uncharacterized protein n=1 Tax=Oryza sativa subsp. indica TaxID=39946 RepID=B8ANH0_ORYSI|nr:hypothetical protein OsI_11396 [Oryza sativa Indica Group]
MGLKEVAAATGTTGEEAPDPDGGNGNYGSWRSVGAGAPVDYLRAYAADLGDHRALEQLRQILRLFTSLKVVAAGPGRDLAPLSFLPFVRLRVLELRGGPATTKAATEPCHGIGLLLGRRPPSPPHGTQQQRRRPPPASSPVASLISALSDLS